MTKETIKKKVHQSYTIQEKVIVVRYALRESNTKAAAKFGLDKSQVGRWVTKLKDQLSEVGHKKFRRLVGGSRKEFFPKEEARLYAWIVEMRNAALAVTYNSLKLEMLRIVSETALKSHELAKRQLASSFKASSTTHQTSDEIRCDEIRCDEIRRDEIYSDEICREVSSENIIIIDSSEDEDDNTNQDIFVEDDEEVLIFATNQ
ncbi:18247_t:CDS:2 [Cetraspora pellucida]|uniref:18247_t:CDS:1 n=1 Tax=Cetraspora pellucida TaxID=1433469 RepID=A0ACA9PFN9_9GLOM|nr:18247_t:CDS:2 [Cetraspora pellucida]